MVQNFMYYFMNIHRCLLLFFFFRENGDIKFLTKGDNNSVDDRGLYAPGQLWLRRKDVVGRARGYNRNLIFAICQI